MVTLTLTLTLTGDMVTLEDSLASASKPNALLSEASWSLLDQLGRLQSLVKQTVSKGAQTSTCLLLILVSLGLIIMPSFSPFSRNSSPDDDYRPTGVVSRNILTDPFLQPTADDVSAVQSDSSPSPFELGHSVSPEGTAVLREPIVDPENTGFDGPTPERSPLGSGSALVSGHTEPLVLGQRKGSRDTATPAHADEM
ncbi:Cyclic AMP-responsive element-binding protein 3-like protein 4 [Liparis tanakae]|uniref:Cyclic AMP-responsive element-binding protein 3-like protein 4 n=1 Tax=Liparis tanakae TaxID=230148 RepID=A0A4Z2FIE1_9TELE|nr:Cyclic AMP-responsive element-binding protein 3-like protein 4 [Liparis tanakae]